MVRGRDQEKYLFSDCAINVNPSAQELAEIAVDSAKQRNYLISIQKLPCLASRQKVQLKHQKSIKWLKQQNCPRIGA